MLRNAGVATNAGSRRGRPLPVLSLSPSLFPRCLSWLRASHADAGRPAGWFPAASSYTGRPAVWCREHTRHTPRCGKRGRTGGGVIKHARRACMRAVDRSQCGGRGRAGAGGAGGGGFPFPVDSSCCTSVRPAIIEAPGLLNGGRNQQGAHARTAAGACAGARRRVRRWSAGDACMHARWGVRVGAHARARGLKGGNFCSLLKEGDRVGRGRQAGRRSVHRRGPRRRSAPCAHGGAGPGSLVAGRGARHGARGPGGRAGRWLTAGCAGCVY